MTQDVQHGTWAEILSARYAAPAGMFSLGVALHAFNVFIASTTMPTAAGELGSAALLSWTASAYLIASIAGGAAAAAVKLRLGARGALYISSAAFMVGTAIFASATMAPVVIVGRALQGAGEGLVVACCYTLIPEIFPKHLVPRIFAIESVIWVTAALGGPLVAGAITEFASWRLAIAISLPLSLIFVLLVPFCVPAHTHEGPRAFVMPVVQLALIMAGIFFLSLSGEVDGRIAALASMGGGVALLVLVVVADGRFATRLLPARAFRLSNAVGAGLLLVLVMTFVEALPSVYVAFMGQRLWGLNALEAGFLAATLAVSWSLTAIAVAHLPRWTVGAYVWPAPLVMAAGLACDAAALSFADLPLAVAGQVLIGVSFGMSWARLCEHVMESAPAGERDFTAAALPTVQSAGLSVGAAFFGALAGWSGLQPEQTGAEVASVLTPLFATGAAIAVAGTIAAVRATQPGAAHPARDPLEHTLGEIR